MGMDKIISVVFFASIALVGVSMATVYRVGGAVGWTLVDHLDYGEWAADKNFRVGDTLIFDYLPQYHNVLRVAYQDFTSCNASLPLAAYSSGYDSVTLGRSGHFFFICGFPGHCQAGQKVHIVVSLY